MWREILKNFETKQDLTWKKKEQRKGLEQSKLKTYGPSAHPVHYGLRCLPFPLRTHFVHHRRRRRRRCRWRRLLLLLNAFFQRFSRTEASPPLAKAHLPAPQTTCALLLRAAAGDGSGPGNRGDDSGGNGRKDGGGGGGGGEDDDDYEEAEFGPLLGFDEVLRLAARRCAPGRHDGGGQGRRHPGSPLAPLLRSSGPRISGN